jgi:hypothetical protein
MRVNVFLGFEFQVSEDVAKKAWTLTDDRYCELNFIKDIIVMYSFSYSTLVSLLYPPHTIAISLVYLACKLMKCTAVPATLDEDWTEVYYCDPENIQGILWESTCFIL